MPRINRPPLASSRSSARSMPRNSVHDRPSRWQMWRRRARSYAPPMIWSAFGLVALFIGYTLVRTATPTVAAGTGAAGSIASLRENLGAATASAGLRVRNIVIEGRANTPEPLLRAAIGAVPGDPILGFSVEAARARIETLTWVEHATVERRLPDTVVVALTERRPFAIWQNQGKFTLVDRTGQIVANQDVAQFRELPLIVGAGAPAAASLLLDALTERPALNTRVLAAIRVGERRWNLRMANGTDVMLPEGAEIAALDRLLLLQKDQAVLDRPLLAVDMRLPDKLVLRPLSDKPLLHPVTVDAKPTSGRKDGAHPDPNQAAGPKRPT